MKYYKVVSDFDGTLASCCFSGDELSVFYAIGEWTEAHKWAHNLGYDLFVFDDFDCAMVFSRQLSAHKILNGIFECDVEGIHAELPDMIPCRQTRSEFEEAARKSSRFFTSQFWPSHTVMVDRVKLLRKAN